LDAWLRAFRQKAPLPVTSEDGNSGLSEKLAKLSENPPFFEGIHPQRHAEGFLLLVAAVTQSQLAETESRCGRVGHAVKSENEAQTFEMAQRTKDADSSVSGIVLAGTYQWTGSLFEGLRPRPLLPVGPKPIIDHVLDWLDAAGVRETTICANGSTAALRQYLDGCARVSPAIGYHEDVSPRGAAGCVKDAAKNSSADTFIVSDGTSIPTVDVAALLAHHRQSQAVITIVVNPRPSKMFGQPQLHPTGTYVFAREVLDSIPETSFQDIKESLIPKMYREGRRVALFETAEVSPRVFNADSYLAANRWVVERMAAGAHPEHTPGPQDGAQLIAHPTAWVDEGALIIGPVILGPGVRVHASATIVGPTVIGAGTTIGRGATIARSVTWNHCVVGDGALVDHCLLAEHAVVDPEVSVSQTLKVKVSEPRVRRFLNTITKKAGAGAPDALARPLPS
jgi:mannose-1-phosphate guanylyltransferase